MKVNYHTHTKRCNHAQGDAKAYVDEAIRCGFDILGMSDHGPYPDHVFGWHMQYEELSDYLDEVEQLKREREGQLKIYAGLEIEYLPKYRDYYEELVSNNRLDYLILGQHIFQYNENSEDYISAFGITDTKDCVLYAHRVAEGLDTGLYSALAHPDLYMMGQHEWDANCDRAIDIILNAAVKNDMVLELNANGIRRGLTKYSDGVRYPYPVERFWKEVKNAGLATVVGSDCHEPGLLWDEAVEKGYKMLEEWGIAPVDYLKTLGRK